MSNKDHSLDIRTPLLDDFLGGEEIRRLTPNEKLRVLRQIFSKEDPERALEELHPFRILAMWRIVRFTLTAKGRLSSDEALGDATAIQPSPWDNPTKSIINGDQIPRGTGKLVALHAIGDGFPLLCPEADQEAIEAWCDATGLAAALLGVGNTEKGAKGLRGLLLPSTAAQCCPTEMQVLAFESNITAEALDLLVTNGEPSTMRHYRDNYGFTRAEALTLVKMARAMLTQEGSATVEENRAMAVAMLKQYLEEVGDTPNMRDRLLAIKELVRVQGVTKESPEDLMKEFGAVVRSISEKREKRELSSGKDGASDVAFEVIQERSDEDALDAFDRESK